MANDHPPEASRGKDISYSTVSLREFAKCAVVAVGEGLVRKAEDGLARAVLRLLW